MVKKMSSAGKKMQAAIAKSVEEAESQPKVEERFMRTSEEDKDEFYRWEMPDTLC